MFGALTQSALQLLPAETAHDLAKWGMRKGFCAPGLYSCQKPSYMFGTMLANPLGLAAGFDKNGELVDSIHDYGFGFAEVGSVTARGGPGNPKPRLFRVYDNAIMNRMGLNGDPAEVVAKRLARAVSVRFGVSIVKTHDPEILGDKAIDDIKASYNLLKHFGLYTVLNISCPNAKEGKTFEDTGALRELLFALDTRGHRALLLKISPTLTDAQLSELVVVAECNNIAGYVCCNTLPHVHPLYGKGGLSGPSLFEKAVNTIASLRRYTTRVIIACGGISTGAEMYSYQLAGADFFQAYNGFVRGPTAGPAFAHRVLKRFEDLGGKKCSTSVQ